MFLYNESLQLWNVIFPSMVLRIIIFELEGMPHFIFYLMTWSICHAFIYGFIVKQVCFVPWCSVGFLEWLLTYSGIPKFPRFPSLSVVPYWDFYNYLCNYPTLSLYQRDSLTEWRTRERNSELDARSMGIIQSEQQREKRLEKKKKTRTSGCNGTTECLVCVSSDSQKEIRQWCWKKCLKK